MAASERTPPPRPGTARAVVVAAPPGRGEGFWAGAPSAAVLDPGGVALAYRVREGHDGQDRNVVAVSADGVRFEQVAVLTSDRFAARWVERPTLIRRPDGGWRLYVCCASRTTAAWWVEALDADTPAGLATVDSRVVMPATRALALKDPVVQVRDGVWRAWVCAHLLDVPGEEDRMRAEYATSGDGLDWTWHGTVLDGRPGRWDSRGVRVTAVLADGRALYDGRASAEQNWFERSGVATPGPDGRLLADDHHADLDVRYVEALTLPSGAVRLYYEARRADGSHELRTELVPA